MTDEAQELKVPLVVEIAALRSTQERILGVLERLEAAQRQQAGAQLDTVDALEHTGGLVDARLETLQKEIHGYREAVAAASAARGESGDRLLSAHQEHWSAVEARINRLLHQLEGGDSILRELWKEILLPYGKGKAGAAVLSTALLLALVIFGVSRGVVVSWDGGGFMPSIRPAEVIGVSEVDRPGTDGRDPGEAEDGEAGAGGSP